MLVKMMSLPSPHVRNLAQEMRKGRERLEMANSGAAGTGDIKTLLSFKSAVGFLGTSWTRGTFCHNPTQPQLDLEET